MSKSDFESKLQKLKPRLGKTTLVAVSKYSQPEEVEHAYNAGVLDFGENRVSELTLKAKYFEEKNCKRVRWHFIGHLQTNKVRDLLKVPRLFAIHSVDSLRLLEEIYKRENDFKGESLHLFLQVNTSREEEKSGFESMDELLMAIDLIKQKSGESRLKLHGLMTMATIRTSEPELEAQRCFQELAKIREQLTERSQLFDLKLSMGMSNDFEIAIKYGSDYVRLGSILFK